MVRDPASDGRSCRLRRRLGDHRRHARLAKRAQVGHRLSDRTGGCLAKTRSSGIGRAENTGKRGKHDTACSPARR
jgi:hypothetical protein